MAKICQKAGCNNPVYSHLFCRIHQWMRTDDDYKRQKEYAKENRKAKKKIPAESKRRKKEHIRYIDQVKMFKQEMKEKGEYFCFVTGQDFDNTLAGAVNTHHLRGRVGDYYLDKQYWILVRNQVHLDVFHGHRDIMEISKEPWWDDFLTRLRSKDELAYRKIMKQLERANELF